MSLLAELIYARVPAFKASAVAPARPAVPPPSKPETSELPTSTYCLRVRVPLVSEESGYLGEAVGEGTDWKALPRTMAYCMRHEQQGATCQRPQIKVKSGEEALVCHDGVRMEWFRTPQPWTPPS